MTNQHWRMVLWGSMLLFVAWVTWSARVALIPFAFGAVVAYALTPIVDRLASLIPARSRAQDKLRRGVVVLLIYVVFFGAVGGIGVAIVPTAFGQASNFVEDLPQITEEARVQLTEWVDRYRATLPTDMREEIDSFVEDFSDRAAEMTGSLLGGTVGSLTGAIGIIAGFLVVPFWLFYALRDRHFIERNFMRAVPGDLQEDVANIGRISDSLLGRYIRAQALLGIVVGVAVGLSMTLLGVQFSIGLGLWAGITELIPILGPWLGGIPGVIIVLATQPDLLLPVILVYFVVQQLENNLLVPRIQGDAVDIHPAMVIMLLVVFGAVWGLIGMIVAVPLTAIVRELFWYADRRLRGVSPTMAFALSHVGQREADMPLDARIDSPASQAAEDEAVRTDPENEELEPGAETAEGNLDDEGDLRQPAARSGLERDSAG